MRTLLSAGVLILPFLIASGCGKGVSSSGTVATKVNSKRSTTEVTLTEGSLAEIDQAVKDTDKAVVIVEFWSLATEPSPELTLAANSRAGASGGVQAERAATLGKDKVAWHGIRKAQYLAQKYEGYFLRVIAVNVDGPGKKDEVLKHLKSHDARHVTNFILTGDPSKVKERYGFDGKAPYQVVFGRNGNKAWATGDPLTGTFDELLFTELDK